MYQYRIETIEDENRYKYLISGKQEENPLTYADFIRLLQQEELFCTFFVNLLADVRFRAYQWETPPVTSSSLDQTFEFVVSRNPGIDLPPDPGPFRQYFNASYQADDEDIVVFDNLGGDAKLIAPMPVGESLNYSHIGVFNQQAPIEQQRALWRSVGRVTENKISDRPLWLNTAGGGVAWLHVRLDSAPKYYKHRPYASR